MPFNNKLEKFLFIYNRLATSGNNMLHFEYRDSDFWTTSLVLGTGFIAIVGAIFLGWSAGITDFRKMVFWSATLFFKILETRRGQKSYVLSSLVTWADQCFDLLLYTLWYFRSPLELRDGFLAKLLLWSITAINVLAKYASFLDNKTNILLLYDVHQRTVDETFINFHSIAIIHLT